MVLEVQENDKKQITFAGNHHHSYGLNFTVRMGTKWANLEIGQQVKLVDEHGRTPIPATILMVVKTMFCEIPHFVLEREHDEKCRTMFGLYKILKQFYTDLTFKSDVTCIGYMIEY